MLHNSSKTLARYHFLVHRGHASHVAVSPPLLNRGDFGQFISHNSVKTEFPWDIYLLTDFSEMEHLKFSPSLSLSLKGDGGWGAVHNKNCLKKLWCQTACHLYFTVLKNACSIFVLKNDFLCTCLAFCTPPSIPHEAGLWMHQGQKEKRLSLIDATALKTVCVNHNVQYTKRQICIQVSSSKGVHPRQVWHMDIWRELVVSASVICTSGGRDTNHSAGQSSTIEVEVVGYINGLTISV